MDKIENPGINPCSYGHLILTKETRICNQDKIASSISSAGKTGQICVKQMKLEQFLNHVVVQLLSHVQLFAIPRTATHLASLSFTVFQSLLKIMSIELVMPFNHLTLYRPITSCPKSFPASGFFSISQSLHQVAKVLELQLQHQSYQ